MPSATEPLDRDGFRREVLARLEGGPAAGESRFVRLLKRGRLPPGGLRRYALSVCATAQNFIPILAGLVEKAPDRKARSILMENLMEEQGLVLRRDQGVVLRADQSHPALARRFALAVGVPENALTGPFPLGQLAEGKTLLDEGRWLEAAAFVLLGQEHGFGPVSQQILSSLKAFGLAERDLAFFAVHGEADCRHGEEGVGLVVDRALTAQEQEACLSAIDKGQSALSALNGGVVRSERAAGLS